jgi:hypothetical protein
VAKRARISRADAKRALEALDEVALRLSRRSAAARNDRRSKPVTPIMMHSCRRPRGGAGQPPDTPAATALALESRAVASADRAQSWRERLQFSGHALARFAQRAGLPDYGRDELEALVRALVLAEGTIRHERPQWARSSRSAALYVVLGTWMLFPTVMAHDGCDRTYVAVTAISSTTHGTWRTAVHAGFIQTSQAHQLLLRYTRATAAPPRPL